MSALAGTNVLSKVQACPRCRRRGAARCLECRPAARKGTSCIAGLSWKVSPGRGAHLQQRQAEIADLGEQAVQGRLVGERPNDGGLAARVAADPQACKPGRPAAV